MFDEDRAKQILTQIRLGQTIAEAVETDEERLEVYDWMRDKAAKVDGKPFKAAYAQAQEDQRLSWLDEAKRVVEDVELFYDRRDNASLKKANDHARLLISLSKERASATKVVVGQEGEDIQVTIRRFGGENGPDGAEGSPETAESTPEPEV